MNFLKTIRFDLSDDHVFESAAGGEEWAIPGGFVHAQQDLEVATGKTRQAFRNGFLSVQSFGFSTFVSVCSMEEKHLELVKANLSEFLFSQFGAPDRQAAENAALEEIRFVLDMCSDTPVNSVLSVVRELNEDGEIREEFRVVQTAGEKPHARVWEIVEDQE